MTCTICRGPYRQVRQLDCGHLFCRECARSCILEDKLYCNICGEANHPGVLQSITYFIRTTGGTTSSFDNIDVDTMTYAKFHQLVAEAAGWTMEWVRLIHYGKMLYPTEELMYPAVKNCTSLTLIGRMSGD